MSNTVITNYTDLNGPSTKTDNSVVVIVNKDGSLSVDQKLLGTLMGTDGTQGAISVVRVGHEGKPDDATDSETDDEKVHHVTLSVDSYYNEPDSIIKYDSGAEMLQSLRIETRENSLVGFQNDHCYTPLTSPSQQTPKKNENQLSYEESVIEITQSTPPPPPPPPAKTLPSSKKITILEQQIIPKGKKILINATESPVILKGNDVLNKPLPTKTKDVKNLEKLESSFKPEENIESSSISSSGESIPDRDSDSDYRDAKEKSGSFRLRKAKLKPRILKSAQSARASRLAEHKATPKVRANKSIIKKENKDKTPQQKVNVELKDNIDLETILPSNKISTSVDITPKEISKVVVKQTPKPVKKEKKTPAHVTALLSDMTSLFSTPDVIRRVSTDNKTPVKDVPSSDKKIPSTPKSDLVEAKVLDVAKTVENVEKAKQMITPKTQIKHKEKVVNPSEKVTKAYDPIPQLDEVSLAQILQDTSTLPTNTVKSQPTITTANTMSSPGLAGPLSPTLDLLAGLQPEEEGLTEDLLMHVAQLVESSENLQEVIDKQVLGKVDTVSPKSAMQSPFQQAHTSSNLYAQTLSKTVQKNMPPRKDPIEIVRRDGRVITLPPIEAPATRSSKRKIQMETSTTNDVSPVTLAPESPVSTTPEPQVQAVSKQYVNKKLTNKKQESLLQTNLMDKLSAESQESWNSEDDPNRLWCICKQPHNNRFMICCDSCEDWFHGKCVNITKAMGQQMEEQGIEWRCPNCIKKAKGSTKTNSKSTGILQKKNESDNMVSELATPTKDYQSKTSCIVCKKPARASSIYCSDTCILKHAQDSLGNQTTNKLDAESGKSQEKQKSESRVIVYERKSGRLLAGPNAPTAENLKAWLQKNPTFEVVRPGTLNAIKPNTSKKKATTEPNKIQTTLNFEKIPRKLAEQSTPAKPSPGETKERPIKLHITSQKEEPPKTPPPKTPVTPKSQLIQIIETPKASTSVARTVSEPRKPARNSLNRTPSVTEKTPAHTPSSSRRKDIPEPKTKMNTEESIRDNVRKSLQEQMTNRMAEYDGPKFSEDEIQQYAFETEDELHDLFRDVGMKYKAKYRSLMFNIKDRKNLTLWEKICERSITPKQLVRLSPEELASQELAQWRDKEAKHQLELIKKSELDLLAASKTYVLKTHKGEEVMETKESVSTELDPNVPVEDVVSVLNDAINDEQPKEKESSPDTTHKSNKDKKGSSRKRERDSSTSSTKKSRRESKRDSNRKSRSSRRKRSESHERESREGQRRSTRKSDKKSTRSRSSSRDRSKIVSKEKSESSERSRRRSRSKDKSRRRSKSRTHSRSNSKGRARSRSRGRSKRRSHSRDSSKRRHSSRTKRTYSTDDKFKQRSRSQETLYTKSKNDSTDSESLERPKSAMLKDQHPEYDPHEPMITSAFSEEDLRKSREDMYDETYKNEIDGGADYDPSKTYSIDADINVPDITYNKIQEKLSEAESDQEPTSTVENSAATVWNGCINMVDVARFYVAAHEVSGSAVDLEEDLTTELDIVGRINPDTVWDYIGKMKKANNKDIVILRLQAANDEEKMQYIALYSYLSSRNRLGVVKVSSTTTVKDFYIVPLPANTTLPPVLLPLDGPGIGEVKTHLLLAIVIRQRKKRLAPHIPRDVIPAKVVRKSQKRSYTPPMLGKSTYTPPTSPRRRAPLPMPAYMSSALSNTVKDKIAASLACTDDEAYSPGSSSSSSSSIPHAHPSSTSNTLRTKMEELNRQIEEQKQQILKIAQANSSKAEEEAYSPSRPMSPPGSGVPLADIALPSNLHEILATIKQRSESSVADVDMRPLPPLP
ncbi:death-inducer obliterator 1 isoform X2 [Manduca sexta]|uniref:death-inducer obliterator 1 isoform X2 n=1 Tax=Manduca sexta TaxID=7130 RepID=UPI00189035FB|nr:death-inducer obliterator 1 isoform X2 [Manduca sexta]